MELQLGVPLFSEETTFFEMLNRMRSQVTDLLCRLQDARKHYLKVRKERDTVFEFLREWEEEREKRCDPVSSPACGTLSVTIHNSDFQDFPGLKERVNTLLEQEELRVIQIATNFVRVVGKKEVIDSLYENVNDVLTPDEERTFLKETVESFASVVPSEKLYE
jgi:hypothetical protein